MQLVSNFNCLELKETGGVFLKAFIVFKIVTVWCWARVHEKLTV